MSEPIVIVGAGMGGLSAAALLAAAGQEVLVLERQAAPGGKLRQVMVTDAPVDAGPTVFTMRWVFDRLFAEAGGDFGAEVRMRPCHRLARHAWDDRGHFDLFADQAACEDAVGAFFGAREAAGYRAFCAEARTIYQVLEASFIDASRPTPLSLMTRIGLARLPQTLAIKPHQTLWRALGRHFRDPRLRQLFGRYATYCGASPFEAPATLMLIAHVEREGVWIAEDGMHAIARALAARAEACGARLRYGVGVRAIRVEGGRATGVETEEGEVINARAVLVNADPAALATGRFGAAARRSVAVPRGCRRSLSSMTWLLDVPTAGFPLIRHTVFFSSDYAAEFEAIFGREALPAEPTVYVCAQDRDDEGALSPRARAAGTERLQFIVNAPARGDGAPFSRHELAANRQATFALLARCGLAVAPAPGRAELVTPADYEGLFPATGGALYGLAAHGWRAPFTRPAARSRLPGLYLAGGGVHPGAGLPMASLSGRLAARAIIHDLASR